VKVFLDTNVLASALATRGLCAELFESVLTGHELLTSRELIAELRRILTTKLRIPADTADAFLTLIEANATTLPTPAEFPAGIPDPDDAPLIAAALAGGAECFVTGDKALLDLGSVGGVAVISPRRFWELTRHGG
jgi:putative PIN family toxin of toxin-antitoxin system